MGRGGGSGSHGHTNDYEEKRPENYYLWLAFCTVGMVSSLTIYGIALEYATSGGRKLHEISFVFVTTTIYACTAFLAREFFNESRTDISKYQMMTLSVTSILSTVSSVRSLRYVIYPVQVLFKSCKPVPVMLFGAMLGKKYPLRKYVNVILITLGVALFMGGGTSATKKNADVGGGGLGTTIIGGLLLAFSLCFDGATGAYEDKLMAVNNVEPFDLMFNIQLGKSFISFIALVITNNLGTFIETLHSGGLMLFLLGLTGALGQVFVFVTIAKFGALNSALIGLVRKILSLVLSFVLYGHVMNAFQTLGLVLAITSMIANFYEKGGSKQTDGQGHGGDTDALVMEAALRGDERRGLMSGSIREEEGEDDEDGEERASGVSSAWRPAAQPTYVPSSPPPRTSIELQSFVGQGSSGGIAVRAEAEDEPDQSDDFDVDVSVTRVTPIKTPVASPVHHSASSA